MALASARAGHEIVAVLSRTGESRFGPPRSLDQGIPRCDLALIAVSDDAVGQVGATLATRDPGCTLAAHMSGFLPLSALRPLADAGIATGGFHPLQTFPDADRGAAAIPGSFAGVGGDESVVAALGDFASSLGMKTFTLRDESRPGYHAGAAAASNFVVTAVATANDLLTAAGVDPRVMAPLVQQVVANALSGDPVDALTGPIARGDLDTVRGHLTAAAAVSPEVGDQFRLLAEATAIRAGRAEEVADWS
jgi:predicted short-subunit dehydrogenase-like oxidoreductase (DUF2520 family)